MPAQTLTEFAERILEDAKYIDAIVAQNPKHKLSHDIDQPPTLSFIEEDASLESARTRIIENVEEISRLVLGPAAYLRKLGWQYGDTTSLRAITRWQIHKAVPLGEERSFADIARACGCPEDELRRLLRHAMTNKVFVERRSGFVAHTASSAALVKDPALCDFITLQGEDNMPSTFGIIGMIEKFGESEEPNHAGFNVVENTNDPFYKALGKDPPRAARFGRGLGSGSGSLGYGPEGLRNFNWRAISSPLVVDVGGSHGDACIAIARYEPSLKFIVQDLPEIISSAESHLPTEFSDRIQFQTHDFFSEQTVIGAGVYLFRWIFHNWSDKYCIRILKGLVPALKPGSRVLLHDSVLPEPNTSSWAQERYIRHMDLLMMGLFNSKLRTLDEWKQLFEKADSRFVFKGANVPDGHKMAIIEALWEER